ncbi:hypothetical protein FRB99_003026 [Tulasnella sp. 403]|nr:hypothetical protein FRB99_003026 [Tulasnella sp. 403]
MASSDAAVLPSFTPSAELAASLDDYADDIAGWINNLLDTKETPESSPNVTKSSLDLTGLDKQVQHLATRLDVAAQDTSSQLEQAIDDISRTIPRLTYDLQFMRESALSLQDALQSIEKSRRSPSATEDLDTLDTKQVLERLHYLDTVKAAMEKTYSVLREAEAWSTLDSEITTLLLTQSYASAASRLSEASRSLALFSNTPEYESRRALMISLQNQLEAALSSALVAAINKRDVAACKGYYDIFSDIQREVEFRNYYFTSRRKGLVELWSNARLIDCEGEGDSTTTDSTTELRTFAALLKGFLGDFKTLLEEERSYTVSIFPDPQQTLSSFIQSTIDALNPSLPQRLSSMSEHYGPIALPHLIQAFKSAEEFAVATDKILESAGYSALFSVGTTSDEKPQTPGKPVSRRTSKRMSLSRRLGPTRSGSISGPQGLGGPIGGMGAWEQALFEPFIDFQAEYGALEKRHLEESLKKFMDRSAPNKPLSGDTGGDNARLLRERSAAIFDMAEETLERCMVFTHGYGALGLIHAFDHAFSSLLDASKSQVLMAKYLNIDTSDGQKPAQTYQELDYSAEDWDAFQQSLHILEACRAMRDRLRVVDGKIKTTFLQFAGMIQLSRMDPSGLFLPGTTKGEVQLLTQSTLNSAELSSFLDGLIRDSQQGVSTLASSVNSANPLSGSALTPGSDGAVPSPAGGPMPDSPFLLKGSQTAITTFTKSTQAYLQNIILSPLHGQLATYAGLSWTSQQRPKQRAAGATYDLQIPTFSLSPTPTIQRVAEGLLNLPRMFELHADDDALGFSIETLPFVDTESLRRLLSGTTESDEPEVSPKPQRRRLSSASSGSQPKPRINIPPPPTLVLTPEMVSSTWLSSLTLSLLSYLTSTVLPSIRTLSQDGAAQLSSDLGYLSNIVRAMNVEWDELERWKELSEMSDEEGGKKLKELAVSGDEVDAPLRLIAKMRGWRSD